MIIFDLFNDNKNLIELNLKLKSRPKIFIRNSNLFLIDHKYIYILKNKGIYRV
jgi:hypothetical protein